MAFCEMNWYDVPYIGTGKQHGWLLLPTVFEYITINLWLIQHRVLYHYKPAYVNEPPISVVNSITLAVQH